MKTYQIHSAVFNATLEFKYAENGVLTAFKINTEDVNAVQVENFVAKMMVEEQGFLALCKRLKIQVTEVLADLSFTAFWDKYNYKDGGSKKKAELLWNKLPEGERTQALQHITRYEQHLARQNIAKAYATTYLNNAYWLR